MKASCKRDGWAWLEISEGRAETEGNKIRESFNKEKIVRQGRDSEKECAFLDSKRKSAALSSQETSKARIQEQRAVKISSEQRNTFDTYGIC